MTLHFDPPERISRYRIGSMIGRGGMGVVYRGTEVHRGSPVAIKLLHPHLGGDPTFRERFLREAHFASLITSEHTVRLLEYGEEQGIHFLVMELVEGVTLKDILAAGPVPSERAINIARQTARALEHAAGRGLIHRDIKPENIGVMPNGHVKIFDFGISRRLQGSGLTVAGAFIGTPTYSAPETFGGTADTRSDIYSLGAVLFHMLAGRPPFRGTNLSDLIKQVERQPPPMQLLAGQQPRLAELVGRCLEKDPARRFQHPAELLAALDSAAAAAAAEIASQQTIIAPPGWQQPRAPAHASGSERDTPADATIDLRPARVAEARASDPDRADVPVEAVGPPPQPGRPLGRAPLLLAILAVGSIVVLAAIAVSSLLLGIGPFSDSEGARGAASSEATEESAAVTPAPFVPTGTTETGLVFSDIETGDVIPDIGDPVLLRYTVFLADGEELLVDELPAQFGSSGDDQFSRAIAETVATMRLGGLRRVIIPPERAFGGEGLPNDEGTPGALIPGASTLTVDVELLPPASD